MTLDLTNAVVYDIETFPNAFTVRFRSLYKPDGWYFEISEFRDDRTLLLEFLNFLASTQTPMIGFNIIHFDYPVIHFFFMNPNVTVQQIYEFAMHIINSNDRFGHIIWASDRITPQIDLFKIHHFDNRAKTTSLKALQINMRSESVVDMPIANGTVLTESEITQQIKPYNYHDVDRTLDFTFMSMKAIEFRISLINDFGIDVMNWSDTKIGTSMMENKLGYEICYDHSSGRKQKRQTPRSSLNLNDMIFPYIEFKTPEFQRVLDYLKSQTLKAEEVKEFNETPTIKTKGVFKGLVANVGGIEFHFGVGGIHGSVSSQRIEATEEWLIRDIDVASLYPSIAIVNGLAPEHLGERFVEVYAELPKERKRWQAEKGKKCVEANTLKLASNGVYGNSNNKFSVFYDPKFTVTITVNGQLMLCMLAEMLLTVPTLKIIQINTDGITYYIHKDNEQYAKTMCKFWEQTTKLVLEDADYSRMWVRDVNNYVAEDTDGNLKLKGAYWSPNPLNYHDSIGDAQPPAWHKDLGNVISIRAAVAAMVNNTDPELFIKHSTNPYDFMCRIKTKRSDKLFHGGKEIQKTTRYYVSTDGEEMVKMAPPSGPEGRYKRKNGVSETEYMQIMNQVNWQWDERVCTKNQSVYEPRTTKIQAGYKTTVCNHINDFDFSNINYDWYVNEAKKLIIS